MWSGVDDPTLDNYLNEARSEMNPEVREHLYHLVQMYAYEGQDVLTLYLEQWYWAFRSKVFFPVRADTAIQLSDCRILEE